jgi:hypothetical protein
VSPTQLKIEDFKRYPPRALKLAVARIALLRQLPLGFVPFLLKEFIAYDWNFPVEQRELDQQLIYLDSLPPEQRQRQMAVFAQLRLSPRLESFDWVNAPGQFLEQLSAHLWATHQMDAFRAASEEYVQKMYAASQSAALPIPRLGIVVIGQAVTANKYPLFRKLRRQGTYFTSVKPDNGWPAILEKVKARATAHPVRYGHWYIDGGAKPASSCEGLTCVSYDSLAAARSILADKMRRAYEAPRFDPEALRTMLAQMRPEDLGMTVAAADPVLNRFQISLLTEGSGTQVFSTTFVQWAAREAFRRAQPITLVARFAPRQREKPMNELLAGTQQKPEPDPPGSLIDADMGAYYTWINQQRLSGADRSSFLVWFEDHTEAVAIGPSLARGTVDSKPANLDSLIERVSGASP